MRNWLLCFFAFFAVACFLPFVAEISVGEEVFVVTVGELEVELEEFVARVLASEGGSCESLEAKKALAVAIRSTARYASMYGLNHVGYDFCTDPKCCIALSEREAVTALDSEAVELTRGEVLLYDSRPAVAFFTLCSGSGTSTRDGFPYITAVREEAPCEVHFVEKVIECNGFFRGDIDSAVVYDDCGKCVFGVFSGRVVTASEIMEQGGLPSNELSVAYDGGRVRLTCRGVGNGLGLNLCNAEQMAKSGSDYKAILKKYFPNLDIT